MDRSTHKHWATVAVFAAVIAINSIVPIWNPTIITSLTASVNFSSGSGKTISPVWNCMNIWDVTMVPADMTTFKAQHPTVDTLVLMTATGGRPDEPWYHYSNDYVKRLPNGTLVYNFTNLNVAVDRTLNARLHLELVIGNVPHALANKTTFTRADYGAFDALTLPPKNYTEYRWYIGNLTAHCISRWGVANVSSWKFRLMTEPDNRDWWTATIEEYIQLWMATFGPIKAAIPNATIVLGNMASNNNFAFATRVLQDVAAQNVSLLPDMVSFSYYHDLRHPPSPDDLSSLVSRWLVHLASLGINKKFTMAVEEGMILTDENGKRLWAGDGTELGAAWNTWMISSVIGLNFDHFVQWDMNFDGFLGPHGLVHLMAQRMVGSTLVNVSMNYSPLSMTATHLVGGFASKNASGGVYRALLYKYTPQRSWKQGTTLDVSIQGLPAGTYNETVFRIDGHENNWFTTWLQNSTGVPRYPDGSIYDLDIRTAFNNTAGYAAWGKWKLGRSDPLTPVPEPLNIITIGEDGSAIFHVALDANCVVLLELARM